VDEIVYSSSLSGALVPEPAVLSLGGLAGVLALRRRRV
jgi:MYXO-CTERM domain-containing protein